MLSLFFARKQLLRDSVGPFVAIFIAFAFPLISGVVSLLMCDVIGFALAEPMNVFIPGMMWFCICDIFLIASYSEPSGNKLTWKQVFEIIKNLRYHSMLFWLSMFIINMLACVVTTFVVISIELGEKGFEPIVMMWAPVIWTISSFCFLFITPKGLRQPDVS